MNVIDAAWRYGRALSDHNWCGCHNIESKEWELILGSEMAIRLQEILDDRYCRYGFNGPIASLSTLEALKEPASREDPINYWIALKNAVSDCDEIASYAKALQSLGVHVDSVSKELFGMAEDVNSLSDMPSDLLLCHDELVVSIKRTGALNRFKQSLLSGGQIDPNDLKDYCSKREEAIKNAFTCAFDERANLKPNLSRELCSAIDGMLFLNSLVNKATLWGFLNSNFSAKVSDTNLSSSHDRQITKIALSSNDGFLMVNKVFSAIALMENTNVTGYLIPDKMSLHFSNSSIDVSCSGLFYPNSDRALFSSGNYFIGEEAEEMVGDVIE